MREIFDLLINNKKAFIVILVILYIAEVILTWVKYKDLSLQQAMTIFVEIVVKLLLIFIVLSAFKVLKKGKCKNKE